MTLRSEIIGVRPDGHRIFVVVLELCNILFALAYAYPARPVAIMDEEGQKKQKSFAWRSVSNSDGMREAIRDLLRTSDVLEALRRRAATSTSVSRTGVVDARLSGGMFASAAALILSRTPPVIDDAEEDDELFHAADSRRLSARYQLGLYGAGVPTSVQQMVESVCGAYLTLRDRKITNREDIVAVLRVHQLIQPSFRMNVDEAQDQSQTAVLRFCAERTVEWMQPFFARHINFLVPRPMVQPSFEVRDHLPPTRYFTTCPSAPTT